jgi:predicted O-methyltransferase YrrM
LVLEGREYDLVFIDGSHSRYTVTLDIINSVNLIRAGGIIVLDDVSEGIAVKDFHHGGPNSVLPALLASGRFDLISPSQNTMLVIDRRARN